MPIFGAQVALGQAGGSRSWYILWSMAPGSESFFTAWLWADRNTASMFDRYALGSHPANGFNEYRIKPQTGEYAWRALQGGMGFGTWWEAKHLAWIYTDKTGEMELHRILSDEQKRA